MPTASSRWNAASSLRGAVLALALGAAPGLEASEPAPVIREIAFRGNEVTQPKTMLREMVVAVGDRADPDAIERSRQGVQDLGLFRRVEVFTEPVDGGVRLVFTVKEKLYILPLPRADASSDGGYGYGAQLRWDNVWGLNHTFNPYFERRQPSEGSADPEKRGVQTRAQLRYTAPFVFDSENSLYLALGYFKTPYQAPIQYTQEQSQALVLLSRKLTGGHGSQGWIASSGLRWTNEENSESMPGVIPPRAAGQAYSLVAGARYRDLHFNVYSDEGLSGGFAVEGASTGLGSDYDFTAWGADFARYWYVGDTEHQNLDLLFTVAGRHDKFTEKTAFAIGGVETVRGFEPETGKGDLYYRASVEFLRPVYRRSVRALFVLDAANAFVEPNDFNLHKVYVSAGLGVRVRIQAFVALDLELGIAWPLNGGPPRAFASKV